MCADLARTNSERYLQSQFQPDEQLPIHILAYRLILSKEPRPSTSFECNITEGLCQMLFSNNTYGTIRFEVE